MDFDQSCLLSMSKNGCQKIITITHYSRNTEIGCKSIFYFLLFKVKDTRAFNNFSLSHGFGMRVVLSISLILVDKVIIYFI